MKVVGLDVGEYRRGAEQRHHFRGRMIGEGRADHRIAAADPPGHQHQQERVGAAGAADRMAAPQNAARSALEGAHFRAVDELAMRQHARYRVIDRAAETAALRRDVDERNRPFFKASMLVHDGLIDF